jgi:5-methylcytosine-specific restriction endonuclease McrA
MRRKFYQGYRQGLWTIVDLIPKEKKALLRCECGYEGWKFLSNLSSHKSQGCKSCMLQTPAHKTYLSVIRTASRRSISWDIPEDTWIELAQQECYYCGSEPGNMISDYGFKYNGLDRVDSSKGYSLTNVVTSCKICNRAKSDMLQKDFYKWIGRAYEQIISK